MKHDSGFVIYSVHAAEMCSFSDYFPSLRKGSIGLRNQHVFCISVRHKFQLSITAAPSIEATMSRSVETSETCMSLSTEMESWKLTPSDWKQRFSASHSLLSEFELAKSDESSVLPTSFLSSSLSKLPLVETYQAKQITQCYIFPRSNNKGNCILRLNSRAHRQSV
jgi:hypothetical protein